MTFPLSREKTFTAGEPITADFLNLIQDQIISLKATREKAVQHQTRVASGGTWGVGAAAEVITESGAAGNSCRIFLPVETGTILVGARAIVQTTNASALLSMELLQVEETSGATAINFGSAFSVATAGQQTLTITASPANHVIVDTHKYCIRYASIGAGPSNRFIDLTFWSYRLP